MPFPALWDSDRPLQPRGRSPDVTARAFPHPFARRLGIAWNKSAKLPKSWESAEWTSAKHDAVVAEVRNWVRTIQRNLEIARGERPPESGELPSLSTDTPALPPKLPRGHQGPIHNKICEVVSPRHTLGCVYMP